MGKNKKGIIRKYCVVTPANKESAEKTAKRRNYFVVKPVKKIHLKIFRYYTRKKRNHTKISC